ncbi:hypothetical protein PI27_gp017 [Listeria phage WIL-1]|nr:hypothetical protein PI27_gp017 [Listeria phage WIL-1]
MWTDTRLSNVIRDLCYFPLHSSERVRLPCGCFGDRYVSSG